MAHLTPFLALMHENPYQELDCLLSALLEITVSAALLSLQMRMDSQTVYRFRSAPEDGASDSSDVHSFGDMERE